MSISNSKEKLEKALEHLEKAVETKISSLETENIELRAEILNLRTEIAKLKNELKKFHENVKADIQTSISSKNSTATSAEKITPGLVAPPRLQKDNFDKPISDVQLSLSQLKKLVS